MNAMAPGGLHADPASLGRLADVRLKVTVEIGAFHLTLQDLLALEVGSVHTLDRRVDQPVDILVNDRLIARGEIVAVDDQRFGVRIVDLLGGAVA